MVTCQIHSLILVRVPRDPLSLTTSPAVLLKVIDDNDKQGWKLQPVLIATVAPVTLATQGTPYSLATTAPTIK